MIGIFYYYSICDYALFREMEMIQREMDRIVTKTRMLSIIQNNRYSPAVIKIPSSSGYFRKTSFCNKRIHCKRKRRIGL